MTEKENAIQKFKSIISLAIDVIMHPNVSNYILKHRKHNSDSSIPKVWNWMRPMIR